MHNFFNKNFQFFIIISFCFVCTNAHASTLVSGTITSNTTWTTSGSPYIITGDVTVAKETFTDLNSNGAWDSSPEPYDDKNFNGKYDSGEPFQDIYPNGKWDAHEPFVDLNDNQTFDPPFVLTIEPGVVIKFQYSESGSTANYSKKILTVNGELHALGTTDSPIVFTSERDDEHGGDSNGDTQQTIPGKGDWGYVHIRAAGSVIQHCKFLYGGLHRIDANLDIKYMLWIDSPVHAVNINHCEFRQSYEWAVHYEAYPNGSTSPNISDNIFVNCSYGIKIIGNNNTNLIFERNTFNNISEYSLYLSKIQSDSSIAQNTISNSRYGIAVDACSPQVNFNTLNALTDAPFLHINGGFAVYSSNTVINQTHNVIAVSGTIAAHQTWPNLGVPYLVNGDITVNAGSKLTIEPGVVVKFRYFDDDYYKKILTVNGVLHAQGTTDSPIVFTSERDDEHGGDSNGDTHQTIPAKGDWGYVRISSLGSTIQHCKFLYGGYRYLNGGKNFMLWIDTSTINVKRCTFRDAYSVAIYYSSSATAASLTIFDNIFENCPTGIQYAGSSATGSFSNISGNDFHNGAVGINVATGAQNLTLQMNSFTSMSSFGLRSTDSSGTLLAQNNWWGDASGPSGSGAGSGVAVTGQVDFSSWLAAPMQQTYGVRNVLALLRGNTTMVDIYYDLNGPSSATFEVSIAVSSTGGEPYTISPRPESLSGHIGSGVAPGSGLHAVWDTAIHGSADYTNTMRVKIIADQE